ncbi:18020_t:CDS:2 [Gigaspora rosea]|nr:18020_t:CDS:2 [Gigaspora rosea]
MSSAPEEPAQDIDPKIIAYIDQACQATITTLVDKVKELINQQNENQKRWNEQIQKTIGDQFNKLEQVGLIDNGTNSRESLTNEEQNNQATPATINSPPETRDDQGNYPPIAVMSDMVIDPIPPKNTKNELSITRNKARTGPKGRQSEHTEGQN